MKVAFGKLFGGIWFRVLICTVVGFLLLYLAWLSGRTFPFAPVSGSILEDSAVTERLETDTITVGTYNIHSTKGTDGKRSVERISEVLSQSSPDFVALNEVRGDVFYLSNHAGELARSLGLGWRFLPTHEKLFSGQFGNAFLSRYQINKFWVMPLVATNYSESSVESSHERNLIFVELEMQGREVLLLMTHLNNRGLRLQQLEQVLGEFEKYSHVILMGDLNTTELELPLKRTLETEGVVDMVGVREPGDPHIDWILGKGFDVLDKGSYPVGPSDHPYYWARVKLKNASLKKN